MYFNFHHDGFLRGKSVGYISCERCKNSFARELEIIGRVLFGNCKEIKIKNIGKYE